MASPIEKHLIRVDTICETCGYRNKLDWQVDSQLNVIACGDCGEILLVPDETTKEEKSAMIDIISQVIKEEKK